MQANAQMPGAASGVDCGPVSFRRYLPPRQIRSVVESIWTYAAGCEPGGLTENIPPDIGSEIIWRTDIEADAVLRGPQFQFGEIAIPSAARYVGARLRPGVEPWFLGIAARQACGSRLALQATTAAMMTGSPEAADQPRRDVERLQQALIRIHGNRDPLRATLGTTALDMISRRHGKISADAVASALGCSARHLRREMFAETGMDCAGFKRPRRRLATSRRSRGDDPQGA
jgi:hypothetical protein